MCNSIHVVTLASSSKEVGMCVKIFFVIQFFSGKAKKKLQGVDYKYIYIYLENDII